MKQYLTAQLNQWLKKFVAFPKWIQGMIIFGFIGIMALGMFFVSSGGASNGAQDPFANSTSLALDVFFKLILVVGLIYVASIVLRRWKGGKSFGPSRQMKVKETIHLTPKRALHLVQINDKLFMVGSTDQSVNLISEINLSSLTELPLELNSSPVGEFESLLSSSIKKNSA
ncbi:MAG TPA: flagellar biosynthetic protein FliO [Leptolinea sp.]